MTGSSVLFLCYSVLSVRTDLNFCVRCQMYGVRKLRSKIELFLRSLLPARFLTTETQRTRSLKQPERISYFSFLALLCALCVSVVLIAFLFTSKASAFVILVCSIVPLWFPVFRPTNIGQRSTILSHVLLGAPCVFL